MSDETGIFEDLIGRSGAKAVLRAALRSGEVDVLLTGEPGSGKSVALLCIEENVPGSRKIDSSGVSRAELREILVDDPPILMLDELDDARKGVYDGLSEPMEDRRVTKAVMGNEIDVQIRTQFFAASNHEDSLPAHIRDRFQAVHFPEYTHEEFVEVCSKLLPRIVGWVADSKDARAVSEAVHDALGSKNVRDARDVARLAGGADRAHGIARALQDPEADVYSEPTTPDDVAALNGDVGGVVSTPDSPPDEDTDSGPFGGVSIPPGADPREELRGEVVDKIESALEQSGREPTDEAIRSVVNGTSEDY